MPKARIYYRVTGRFYSSRWGGEHMWVKPTGWYIERRKYDPYGPFSKIESALDLLQEALALLRAAAL